MEKISNPDSMRSNLINFLQTQIIPLFNKEIQNRQGITEYTSELEAKKSEILKSIKDLTDVRPLNLMILGCTNTGKSSLANTILGGKDYFKVGNAAETYCVTKLSETTKIPFRIQVIDNHNKIRFTRDCKSAEEFFRLKEDFKRMDSEFDPDTNEILENKDLENRKILGQQQDFKTSEIKEIHYFVKDFTKDANLPGNICIQDTPGISEKVCQTITESYLKEHFMDSIILCVMSLESGTPNISDIKDVLKLYRKIKASYRIIFILTKFGNLLSSCSASIKNIFNPEDRRKQKLAAANEVIQKYRQQIMKKYPEAHLVMFELNDEIDTDYYYNPKDLSVVYRPPSNLAPTLCQIGSPSISLLKEKIISCSKTSQDRKVDFVISKIESDMESTLKAISTLYSKDENLKKFQEDFADQAKEILDRHRIQFTVEYVTYKTNEGSGKSNLREDILCILKDIRKKDKQYRFSKENYKNYLISECEKSIPELLRNKIEKFTENTINNIIKEIHEVAQKLVPAQYAKNLAIGGELDTGIDFESDSKWKTSAGVGLSFGATAGLISYYGGLVVGAGTESAVAYIGAGATATALAEGTTVVTLTTGAVIGIALAAAVGTCLVAAGIWTVAWTRDSAIEQVLKELTKHLRSRGELDYQVLISIDQIIGNLGRNLKKLARDMYVQPKSSNDIPDCIIYKDFHKSYEDLKKLKNL